MAEATRASAGRNIRFFIYILSRCSDGKLWIIRVAASFATANKEKAAAMNRGFASE
jgi:hypothetical protein